MFEPVSLEIRKGEKQDFVRQGDGYHVREKKGQEPPGAEIGFQETPESRVQPGHKEQKKREQLEAHDEEADLEFFPLIVF